MINVWLRNRNIKTKLMLIVSIPLVFALILAVTTLSIRYRDAQKYDEFYQSMQLVSAAQALVHEMQKERGMSSGFIGSGGRNDKAPLDEQRRKVDKKNDAIVALFSALNTTVNEDIKRLIAIADSSLQNIPSNRQKVDAVSVNVTQTLGMYTAIIEDLLSFSTYNVNNPPSVRAAGLSSSVWNVTESKEKAGLERGLMSGVFSADTFTPAQKQRFIELKSQVLTFWEFVALYADEATAAHIEQINSNSSFNTYNEMLAIASTQDSNFGVDGTEWFSAATQVINLKRGLEQELTDKLVLEAENLKEVSFLRFWSLCFVVLVVSAISVYLILTISNMVSSTLNSVLGAISEISSGKLNFKLPSVGKDEFGMIADNIEKLRNTLLGIITDINYSTTEISQSAPEISDASLNLSSSVTEQAANLETSSAALEELSAAVNSNAENASKTQHIATSAAEIAEASSKAVIETVEAMKQISEKVTLIEDVAYETKILALNASIEAARAGEYGKGFTVVADEVSQLAASTRSSAAEINDLAKRSVKVAEESGQLLTKMVPEILHTSELVEEISAASSEQAIGISEIKDSVIQLDSATQSNAAMSEQLAATSEGLSNISKELSKQMAFFALDNAKALEKNRLQKEFVKRVTEDGSEQVDTTSFSEY